MHRRLQGRAAMGSVSARPDMQTHQALTRAGLILVVLISDNAGAKAAWGRFHFCDGRSARRSGFEGGVI